MKWIEMTWHENEWNNGLNGMNDINEVTEMQGMNGVESNRMKEWMTEMKQNETKWKEMTRNDTTWHEMKRNDGNGVEWSGMEWMNRWSSEPMNQFMSELVSRRINESVHLMNQWTSEPMNGWMDASLSDLFTGVPLVSATSLSSLLSGLLLHWPCSELPPNFLATSSVASAAQSFFSLSCYNIEYRTF